MNDIKIEQLKKVIFFAGDLLKNHFKKPKDIFLKSDQSPVTQADYDSHFFLNKELKKIKDIPVLSEENIIPFSIRRNWKTYWLIDPLDGTKAFMNNEPEFCINIALMQNNIPILGIIYAPITEELHIGIKNSGCEHYNIPKNTPQERPIAAISRHFHSEQTKLFLSQHNIRSTKVIGAGLKFGRLAVNEIDYYPRLQGSSEWDIAAGDIILQESGGCIIDLTTKKPITYNKKSLENNHFIAFHNKNMINQFIF